MSVPGVLLLLPPRHYNIKDRVMGRGCRVRSRAFNICSHSSNQLYSIAKTRHYRTSALPDFGNSTSINTMCTLKKQCYACKGACVEQVVVHCPSYLAGYDCGQSDVTRAGQAGGMLLQEILHMSPCPKHGIDNPHDQCKAICQFPMY